MDSLCMIWADWIVWLSGGGRCHIIGHGPQPLEKKRHLATSCPLFYFLSTLSFPLTVELHWRIWNVCLPIVLCLTIISFEAYTRRWGRSRSSSISNTHALDKLRWKGKGKEKGNGRQTTFKMYFIRTFVLPSGNNLKKKVGSDSGEVISCKSPPSTNKGITTSDSFLMEGSDCEWSCLRYSRIHFNSICERRVCFYY